MLCYCGWVETTQPNYFAAFCFPSVTSFCWVSPGLFEFQLPGVKVTKVYYRYSGYNWYFYIFFGLHWRDGRCSMFWVPGWPYSWCHVTGFELARNCVQRRKEQHVYSNFLSRWSHPGHSRSSMQSLAKPHQCLVMTCHSLSLVHHSSNATAETVRTSYGLSY